MRSACRPYDATLLLPPHTFIIVNISGLSLVQVSTSHMAGATLPAHTKRPWHACLPVSLGLDGEVAVCCRQ